MQTEGAIIKQSNPSTSTPAAMKTPSGDRTTAPPPPPPPHVVIFPTPGMGQLIPLTNLAKRLLSHFTFTIAIPNDGKSSAAQTALLASLPAGIDAVHLPPVNLSDVPPTAKTVSLICLISNRSLPALRRLIADANRRVNALVVDIFGTDAFDVAREFGVRPYIFFTGSAMALSGFLYMEELDETTSCEFADFPDPIRIPGCISVHGRDLPDPVQDRKNEAYKGILQQAKRFKLAKGIMVNSFEALEEGPFGALLQPEPGRPPIFPIGPLLQTTGLGGNHECLTWLGEQPRGSVLYVSFGSGGTLGREQLSELALGLESSGKKFLWVVKAPNDAVPDTAYFSAGEGVDPMRYLPEGFLERTKGVGLVVPNWAPQVEIMSHPSTGGFLTHCGWNSILESIVNGVPTITWPLYAEQRMNSVLLAEGLKLGIKPSMDKEGIVQQGEVARVVKELMGVEEGHCIRQRVAEMKDAASAALSENGSSTRGLDEIARRWKSYE